MNKKRIIVISIFIIIILCIISYMFYNYNINKLDIKSNIPTINIKLSNITLEELNKGNKEQQYNNNTMIINNSNSIQNVSIKGRGNSTWNWPKKPYQITLDKKTNILNLGESKKWILLANFVDESLLRNHMAFYLGNLYEMNYTSKGENISLYINNQYQGIYYIVPKISINSTSVDLLNDDSILVEFDNNTYFEEDKYYTTNYYKDNFIVKDIKNKDKKETAINNFYKKYNEIEKELNNKNWNKIKELIDIDSFAKYYIISNLTGNGDSYRSSFYMYMDGNNDVIHAGPIWDFDLGFYNNAPEKIKDIELDYNYNNKVANYFNDEKLNKDVSIIHELLTINEFKQLVKDIYNKYSNNLLDKFKNEVHNNYNILKDDANNNIIRWNNKYNYDYYINELNEKFSKLIERFESML